MNRGATALVIAIAAAAFSPAGSAASHNWRSYLQLRYTRPQDSADYFSVRRFKLEGHGPVAEGWQYHLQVLYKNNNRSPTDGLFLQEANLSRALGRGRITVGQFKPPFGMERFTPDWGLALIDRSQPTDRLIPNGNLGNSFARDRGAQWEGDLKPGIRLAAAVFEGSGANSSFSGSGPLLVARASYRQPGTGSGGARAELAYSTRRDRGIDFRRQLPGAPAGYSHFSGRDVRANAALALESGGFSVRAEYFGVSFRSDRPDVGGVNALGYYVQCSRALSARYAVAARYERFDPDRAVRNSHDLGWTTLGATCYLRGEDEKVQVNYVVRSEMVESRGNDALIVQYQRFF